MVISYRFLFSEVNQGHTNIDSCDFLPSNERSWNYNTSHHSEGLNHQDLIFYDHDKKCLPQKVYCAVFKVKINVEDNNTLLWDLSAASQTLWHYILHMIILLKEQLPFLQTLKSLCPDRLWLAFKARLLCPEKTENKYSLVILK